MTIRVFKQFICHLLVIGEKNGFFLGTSIITLCLRWVAGRGNKHHKVWVPICHRYSSNLKYSRLRLRPSSISVLLILYAIVVVLPYVSYGCYLLLLARKTPTRRWIFVDSFRSVDRWTFLLFHAVSKAVFEMLLENVSRCMDSAFVIFWKIPVVLQKMLTTQQTNSSLDVATIQVCGIGIWWTLEMVLVNLCDEFLTSGPRKQISSTKHQLGGNLLQHQTSAVPWQDNRYGLINQQQPPWLSGWLACFHKRGVTFGIAVTMLEVFLICHWLRCWSLEPAATSKCRNLSHWTFKERKVHGTAENFEGCRLEAQLRAIRCIGVSIQITNGGIHIIHSCELTAFHW